MEWTRDERRDLRWASEAFERLRRSLYLRGKWNWMWRIDDLKREFDRILAESSGDLHGTPMWDIVDRSDVA